MSPRKSTKSPETKEGKGLEKAAGRTRGKKTVTPEPELAAQAAPAAPEPVAEAAAPEKTARRGRKPKAAEVVPAPEPEAAVEAAPKPQKAEPSTSGFDGILAAIRDGRAVEFIFADADTNPPRTFEPRQLIFDAFTKAWFVWGWDRRYNAERHHRVDLLAEVNPVEGVGRAAQGPFKEGTPGNQIGGWLGGEPIQVKAVLLKQWIYAVKQAPAPFPEFRMEDLEEGKAQVSFVGTDLRAIARWCMQFGDGIQVLEPQRLIDRIKQVGVAWAGKAAQPAPAAKPEPRQESRQDSRQESRPEPKSEPRHEHRKAEHRHEPKEHHEPEALKPNKAGKIEIRFDRL